MSVTTASKVIIMTMATNAAMEKSALEKSDTWLLYIILLSYWYRFCHNDYKGHNCHNSNSNFDACQCNIFQ